MAHVGEEKLVSICREREWREINLSKEASAGERRETLAWRYASYVKACGAFARSGNAAGTLKAHMCAPRNWRRPDYGDAMLLAPVVSRKETGEAGAL